MPDLTPVISVNIFEVEPGDFDRLVARAKEALSDAATLPGFMRTNVFGNASHSRILLIAEWDSAHEWALALWNEKISHVFTDLIESSRHHEFELYTHLAP